MRKYGQARLVYQNRCMKRIGYARVSTTDQSLNLQRDALRAAGVDAGNVFTDTASGSTTSRPGLAECLDYLGRGDLLVVWKLDRLGRSTRHLIETVECLRDRGVGFMSLSEGMDTTTSGGQLVFTIMAALAQFERDLIRERTVAGLQAARERGRVGGRPRALSEAGMRVARQMRDEGQTLNAIAAGLDVSKATVCRALRPA